MMDTECVCGKHVPVPPGNPDRIKCDMDGCETLATLWCDCRGMALCGESEHPEQITTREAIKAYVEEQRRWRGNFTSRS